MASKSLQLTGASAQYAYINDNASLSITSDITLESWVNFASLPTEGKYWTPINKFYLGGSGNSYALGLENDGGTYKIRARLSLGGISENELLATFTPAINTWYYFAFTWVSGSKVWNIYRGDQSTAPISVASGTTTNNAIDDSTQQFIIGTYTGESVMSLDGKVDEVRIWSLARSLANLQANYNMSLVGNEANLVAYYKFNATYNDTTSNANNLTPNGTPAFSTDVPFTETTTSTSSSTSSSTTTTSRSTSTTTTSTSKSTSTSTSTTVSVTTSTSTTSTSTSTTSTSSSTTISTSSSSSSSTSTTSTSTTLDLTFSVELI